MDKILKLQTEIGVLSKTETNPFFKSKYLDINGLLAQLQPLLTKYELTVVQPLSTMAWYEDGKTKPPIPSIRTMVYDGEERIVDESFPLPDLQDPQKMGSAITYYRRYALQSLFLLQAEDDDGNNTKPKQSEESKDENAFEKAKRLIAEEDDLFGLRNLERKIAESTKLTDKEKTELAFIANEKALSLDPTKD